MVWHAALSRMRITEAPCPGITGAAWPAMKSCALKFLGGYGSQAVELGWTATDVLGVHPTRGTIRADFTGALLL